MSNKLIVSIGLMVVTALIALTAIFGSFYTVAEGHAGIVLRFNKAIAQVEPGLHFKVPFVDTVREIDIRERKNVETMRAATENQLAITVEASMNWVVNKESALELYRKYGSLEQFEGRILDPKFRSAAKAALSRYPADILIKSRNLAIAEIGKELRSVTEGLPIRITSPQIENIGFPQVYLAAVLAKEKEREEAERALHALEKQKTESQKLVNTANAKRDADKSRADGQAYATLTQAKADAEAVRIVSQEIAKNPSYIEYIKAKAWNGTLPTTVLGENANMLMAIK